MNKNGSQPSNLTIIDDRKVPSCSHGRRYRHQCLGVVYLMKSYVLGRLVGLTLVETVLQQQYN